MQIALTTAQHVAQQLDNDGRRYSAPSGMSLDALCRDAGAFVDTHSPADPGWRRYVFLDGSAIVDCAVAWDIEGARPWTWEGVEQ